MSFVAQAVLHRLGSSRVCTTTLVQKPRGSSFIAVGPALAEVWPRLRLAGGRGGVRGERAAEVVAVPSHGWEGAA